MRTFEIMVWEEQGGVMEVEAETEAQAKEIARRYIEDYGFEMSDKRHKRILGLRTTHRETHLV